MLDLVLFFGDASYQALDTLLKLLIFDGIDDWVDTAVRQHQHHVEVKEPAGDVDGDSNVAEEI